MLFELITTNYSLNNIQRSFTLFRSTSKLNSLSIEINWNGKLFLNDFQVICIVAANSPMDNNLISMTHRFAFRVSKCSLMCHAAEKYARKWVNTIYCLMINFFCSLRHPLPSNWSTLRHWAHLCFNVNITSFVCCIDIDFSPIG